jgi:hypothetical protein
MEGRVAASQIAAASAAFVITLASSLAAPAFVPLTRDAM